MRHSHIIALALFAAVGLAVLDDYGVAYDEPTQRRIGYASFNYVLGDEHALIDGHSDRYYGVAFELALIAIERALGLEDARDIYLSRHLLTHLLFLAGGFSAWLLAYRLFGNRLVALLAMLLFLLHPRIYAHSFFNSKDLPFLCVFMVSLYLIRRAFRRDSVWAFALCGAGVGMLMNIRVIGAMLFAAVLGMLALDFLRALRRGRAMNRGRGIKRVFANAAAFSLAAVSALYAAWPILWSDPLALADSVQAMARHPNFVRGLFRDEWIQWPDIPWDYIPAWALATTPPAALALIALGTAVAARLCAIHWRGALANSDARFGLLAAACVVLPVAAAAALNSNLYDDWRQMYFLWAPMSVLAAFGLKALASIPAPRLRVGALALAAVGIALAAVPMVNLHPHQNIYFNPSADAERWELDYWSVATKDALDALLEMRPNEPVSVAYRGTVDHNRAFLPEDGRRRLNMVWAFPEFAVVSGGIGESAVWTRAVYGIPIVSILDSRAESEARYRAAYARARASEPLATAGGFDIYADFDRLVYIKEPCVESDTLGTFVWRATPAVPQYSNRRRLDWWFEFQTYGAAFDGKCLMSVPIPGYEIAALETMRWTDDDEEDPLWRVSFAFPKPQAQYAAALSALPDSPDARAEFDIYADVDRLIYVKSPCAEGDEALGQFRLAVFPADLPRSERGGGAESEKIYFRFHQYGAAFDGKCVMVRKLPDYRIIRVETGRREDGKSLWSAGIRFDGYYDRFRRALSKLPANPSARAGFDLYADLDKRTLTYVKSPCAEDDIRGRFFLSVFPADPSDVEAESRERGLAHNSLNFVFDDYGGAFDGKCAAIRELPDYAIAAIETGQWTDDDGQLWDARMDAGEQ